MKNENKLAKYNDLFELTGQESGVLVFGGGGTIICNWGGWQSGNGIPRVFCGGLVYDRKPFSAERVGDVERIELPEPSEVIYDENGDAPDLGKYAATVYEIETENGDRVTVYAPDGWN